MKNLSLHFSYSPITLAGERAREMKRRFLHLDSPASFEITGKHLKDSQLMGGVFMVKDLT